MGLWLVSTCSKRRVKCQATSPGEDAAALDEAQRALHEAPQGWVGWGLEPVQQATT